MRKIALAAALLACTSGSVLAADFIEPLPPGVIEADESRWAGFHVGVLGGWAQAGIAGCHFSLLFEVPEENDAIVSLLGDQPIEPPEECEELNQIPEAQIVLPIIGIGYRDSFEFDQQGWLLGAQGGYTLAFGDSQFAFLLGGEVDASLADISGRIEYEDFQYGYGIPGKATWTYLATGTLQAGVAFDMFKLYGEVGVAIAGLDFQGDLGCSFSDPQTGLVAGVGAAAMVLDNVSLGAEYNHIWFEDSENHCTFDVGPISGASEIHTAAEMDVFKLNANVHF
jgi:opacity protein-like surface antigen